MPANTFRGWSKHAYNKSKMADGRHFEKKKSPYISYVSTYSGEIWYDDT